jgi:hypothetical protein
MLRALYSLRNDVLMMSSLADRIFQTAFEALLNRDSELCDRVIAVRRRHASSLLPALKGVIPEIERTDHAFLSFSLGCPVRYSFEDQAAECPPPIRQD